MYFFYISLDLKEFFSYSMAQKRVMKCFVSFSNGRQSISYSMTSEAAHNSNNTKMENGFLDLLFKTKKSMIKFSSD